MVRSIKLYPTILDMTTQMIALNNWNNRKLEVAKMLTYYEPEIFGIQEGLEHQLKYLDQHLVSYSRIGVGRDDGKQKGEFSPIYYNKNKFSLIYGSTFWLSNQADTVSVGWDASMERICTYGLFQNKITQQEILVFNTHYDHIGPVARKMSSKLILNKINEINQDNYPVILMGDFNAEPETNPILILKKELKDGAELSPDGIYGPIGTFTGFTNNQVAKERIDYIFVKNLKVSKYSHIDDKMKNNNYLSDHLPVLIELK
jgi:endonuclease/exonuclease/phosphatase family metal-dependent hydrolase